MTHADLLKNLLETVLPEFEFQFGQWIDRQPQVRYAVVKPAGGVGAELVRRPQFTLSLIGVKGGDHASLGSAADAVVELCRETAGEELVYVSAGEPVFTPTADGRPIFEIALSVIAS